MECFTKSDGAADAAEVGVTSGGKGRETIEEGRAHEV